MQEYGSGLDFNSKVKWEGLEHLKLGQHERVHLRRVIEQILNQSPSDAQLKMSFGLEDQQIVAKLKISSNKGYFHSHRTHQNFWELLNEIKTDLEGQFATWKRDRFKKSPAKTL